MSYTPASQDDDPNMPEVKRMVILRIVKGYTKSGDIVDSLPKYRRSLVYAAMYDLREDGVIGLHPKTGNVLTPKGLATIQKEGETEA